MPGPARARARVISRYIVVHENDKSSGIYIIYLVHFAARGAHE